MNFEVRQDDLHETRVVESEAPEIERGQVLLGVDSFGLTTNNITYALVGESMNYWGFFPAEDGWGRVPMWGFADVVATAADGIEEGTRVFGYLPPGTHLVVQPDRPSPSQFVDASPHRAELPAAYNRYARVEGDPNYTEENEDQQMLLWPLYFTSALIDDFLDDEEQEIGSLEREPAAYVDMAGDAKVRSAVHEHYGDELKHDAVVGMTHKDERGGAEGLPGPRPKFFFAPSRLKKRAEDWGGEEVNRRISEPWLRYVEWAQGWLEVVHDSGPEAIDRVYLEMLDGKSDPSVGHVLRPG